MIGIQNKFTFWKYELTACYVFLMLQYLYILVFANNIDREIAKQYVELFYYDIMLFFPIIFLVFFPFKFRFIVFSLLFAGGIIYFFLDLGVDTIVFNTFLSLFLANKFLLFDISEDEKGRILKFRFIKILILFPVIILTISAENALEALGITHPVKLGDGTVMTNYGRFLFFGSFYGGLAYFAYRAEKKKVNNNIII